MATLPMAGREQYRALSTTRMRSFLLIMRRGRRARMMRKRRPMLLGTKVATMVKYEKVTHAKSSLFQALLMYAELEP